MKNENWQRWYNTGVNVRSGGLRHLWVEKRNGKDGIGWDILQHIKNELLGTDIICVEVYPEAVNVVNEINRRHLWEIEPDMLSCVGFRFNKY